MTEIFAKPDDFGEPKASELSSSLGERIGAQASEAFMGGVRTLHRTFEYGAAEGQLPPVEAPYMGEMTAPKPSPEVPIAEAKARQKQEGLEYHLKLPEQPTIKQGVLDLMVQHAHERQQYEAAVSRGPQGFFPDALGFVTEMGAGMIDPVNAAAFMIPVIGEARAGMMMASAGESILARGGVRAGIGATQGAVGGTALVPGEWWLHTKDGQDYTYADALRSIVLSAGMGAGFHAGFGAIGDVRARARGAPLPGSPEDLVIRGLMAGTHIRGRALASEGVSAEEIPGIAASAPRPVAPAEPVPAHPAEILADLPPRVQEDVVRAAAADVIAGRPVRAGDMLAEAGRESPRIAESLGIEAFHGSPHEFEQFSSEKIGTGEGATSYGYGLYFAEHRDVAENYRSALAGGASYKGLDVNGLDKLEDHSLTLPVSNVLGDMGRGHSAVDAIALTRSRIEQVAIRLRRDIDRPGMTEDTRRYNAERLQSYEVGLKAMDKLKPEDFVSSGNLYKVHIAADRERFLDWDKPLREQSEHVKNILENEWWAHPEAHAHQTGEEIFRDIQKDIGEGEETAQRLREAGIPGIKYLDQGSRASDSLVLEYSISDMRAKIADAEREVAEAKGKPGLLPAYFERRASDIADQRNQLSRWEARLAELGKPTSNFVVFDDKLIRITHKNGKEVGLDEMKAQASPAARTDNIDNTHDVVSGANSSKDPNGPVYVDRRIPQFSPKLKDGSGQPLNLWKYLAIHEREEAAAMAEGLSYDDAHTKRATPKERAAVEADGGDWKAYTHEMDGYLDEVEHEKAKNPPPNPHVDPETAIGHHRAGNKQEKATAPKLATESGAVTPIGPRKATGPRARPEETWSLLEFLASRGGISENDPLAGDVRAAIGRSNKFVPGFGNLIRKKGMTLDKAREAAVHAGYIHDLGEHMDVARTSTIGDPLEAMDGELRGRRVYRHGGEGPERAQDPAQREHELNAHFEHVLTEESIELGRIPSKTRTRALEIMDKEGVSDPLEAYERAVMEETEDGAQAGEHERIPESVPGWDVDDAGTAPAAGRTSEGEGQRGAGGPARAVGEGDRAPGGAAGVADFRKFADAQHPHQDADLAAESKAADKIKDVSSTDGAKAVSAAQKIAAETEKQLAEIMPTLSEDERKLFTDVLNSLDQDHAAREQIVRDGAACLAAAVA